MTATLSAFFTLALLAVVSAAALDIGANVLIVKSEGFRRKLPAIGSIILICLAFSALAYAVQTMDLAVAYALWGGFGILGTSLIGALLFSQRLSLSAALGMVLLIGGMATLHLS